MKMNSKFDVKQKGAHLVAIVLYMAGVFLDIYGYLSLGIEILAYVFLTVSTVYSISIATCWDEKNTRILKSTWVHLLFVAAWIIILFAAWSNKLYPTFIAAIVFVLIIGIMLITDLCKIHNAYYYDKWE